VLLGIRSIDELEKDLQWLDVKSTLANDGDAPTVGWIRAFLVSHPAFVPVGPHRWQLGRQLASMQA
jgi:hypothetical protein